METKRYYLKYDSTIYQALCDKDADLLAQDFADDIDILSYVQGSKHIKGKEQAKQFFAEFFKADESEKLMAYCREIVYGKLTGVVDERFKEYSPLYDIILHIEDDIIKKAELYHSLAYAMHMAY